MCPEDGELGQAGGGGATTLLAVPRQEIPKRGQRHSGRP